MSPPQTGQMVCSGLAVVSALVFSTTPETCSSFLQVGSRRGRTKQRQNNRALFIYKFFKEGGFKALEGAF
jgi:hypothetical protein